MKIAIFATGKLKPGPEKDLAGDYLKRAALLGRKCSVSAITISEFPESRAPTPALRMTEESRVLLETVPPLAQLWVLDERGPPMSTAALAAELRKAIDGGLQNLAFAVGGPDGHAGIVRDRARRIISFGEMTWPHRLVRVMLAEQLYRSFTIMTGHPYHRAQH